MVGVEEVFPGLPSAEEMGAAGEDAVNTAVTTAGMQQRDGRNNNLKEHTNVRQSWKGEISLALTDGQSSKAWECSCLSQGR